MPQRSLAQIIQGEARTLAPQRHCSSLGQRLHWDAGRVVMAADEIVLRKAGEARCRLRHAFAEQVRVVERLGGCGAHQAFLDVRSKVVGSKAAMVEAGHGGLLIVRPVEALRRWPPTDPANRQGSTY